MFFEELPSVLICFRPPTVSAKALCFRTVHPPRMPVRLSVRSFVRSSGQISLTRYLMNGLSNLVKHTGIFTSRSDHLIDSAIHSSTVKVKAGRRVGEGILVDSGAWKSIVPSVVRYVRLGCGCVDPDLRRHAVELDRASGHRVGKRRRRHARHSADLQRHARGKCPLIVRRAAGSVHRISKV